jgi:hypothetical protein
VFFVFSFAWCKLEEAWNCKLTWVNPNFKKIYFFFLASCFAFHQRSMKSRMCFAPNYKYIFLFRSCFAVFNQRNIKSLECSELNFEQMHPFSSYFVVFNQRNVKSRVYPNFKKCVFLFHVLRCFKEAWNRGFTPILKNVFFCFMFRLV